MQTEHDLAALRVQLTQWRKEGLRIGLVPTMGNLHAGHLRLVEVAKSHCDRVVATIFVNPMQFGPNEDYADYPRTLAEDQAKLAGVGLDLLFAPAAAAVYPHGLDQMTTVSVPGVSELYCGTARPGHFDGVTTVVAKLFNMIQPDAAFFGEKDFQQVTVIQCMVTDLDMPIEIVPVATVRETDGLAMSSRNGYLSAEERVQAPVLYQALQQVAAKIRQGVRNYSGLEAEAKQQLVTAGFIPDYFNVCNVLDLHPASHSDVELVILAAAKLGRARLIDNFRLSLKQPN